MSFPKNLAICEINGVNFAEWNNTLQDWDYPLPQPSSMTWTDNDVSSSDAGRTDDGVMHKEKIGTSTKLELKWNYLPTDIAQRLIRTVEANEYFTVTYYDPTKVLQSANDYYYSTRTFYVGDRTAPMYNTKLELWENVKYNVIEKGVH